MARTSGMLGLTAFLAAITMLFAAFSSAYIVRRGLGGDWEHLEVPAVAWVSAAALLLARGRAAIPLALLAAAALVESCREQHAVGTARTFFVLFHATSFVLVAAGVIAQMFSRRSGVIRVYWLYLAGLWCWLLVLMTVYR